MGIEIATRADSSNVSSCKYYFLLHITLLCTNLNNNYGVNLVYLQPLTQSSCRQQVTCCSIYCICWLCTLMVVVVILAQATEIVL